MFRLPRRHYKIFGIRILCFIIKLNYWNRKFKGHIGMDKISFYNHSHYDFSGEGFVHWKLFIGLFFGNLIIEYIMPWYKEKENINKRRK